MGFTDGNEFLRRGEWVRFRRKKLSDGNGFLGFSDGNGFLRREEWVRFCRQKHSDGNVLLGFSDGNGFGSAGRSTPTVMDFWFFARELASLVRIFFFKNLPRQPLATSADCMAFALRLFKSARLLQNPRASFLNLRASHGISPLKSLCSIAAAKQPAHLARMAVTFYGVNSPSGLKKLDDYLLTRSYITGYQASKDDLTVYAAISEAPSAEYVNVSRWFNHIDALLRISGVSGEGCGVTVEGSAPITKEAIATPPVADSKASAAEEDDDDDDVDLFGEETEEEKKAAEERAAAVKASGKKKESGKSSVLLDVKPWDDETDMKKLEEAVRSVKMEGLFWGASKLVPVGYGIKKLQIMLTIVDDLVSVDSLIEERLTEEPINEFVQSCDIVAFNKI